MKTRLLVAVMMGSWSVTGGAVTVPGDQSSASPVEMSSGDESRSGKPALKQGMTAETILEIVGKPQEIKRITSPAGEGEMWTYRRVEKQWTQQTAVTMENVPGFAGAVTPGPDIREFSVPSYRIERVKLIQVTRLLMYDGRLVAAVQSREEEHSYE